MLRVGQSSEAANTFGANQNFTLKVTDLKNNSADFQVASLSNLIYPAKAHSPSEPKTVMQSINLTNNQITDKGLNYLELNSISLHFNSPNSSKGNISIDLLFNEYKVRKYFEFDGGIYFKVFNPRFFEKHSNKKIFFLVGNIELVETGWKFPSYETDFKNNIEISNEITLKNFIDIF